jgi:hypothetical protein
VIVWISVAVAVGVAMGVIAANYFPWLKKNRGDTDRFFKASGNNIKFYTMPTLIGTLLVSLSVLNVAFDNVSMFKQLENEGKTVGLRDYQLFQIKVMIAALTTWYAFINPAWQRAREKQKDSQRQNGDTPPPIPERLQTLG